MIRLISIRKRISTYPTFSPVDFVFVCSSRYAYRWPLQCVCIRIGLPSWLMSYLLRTSMSWHRFYLSISMWPFSERDNGILGRHVTPADSPKRQVDGSLRPSLRYLVRGATSLHLTLTPRIPSLFLRSYPIFIRSIFSICLESRIISVGRSLVEKLGTSGPPRGEIFRDSRNVRPTSLSLRTRILCSEGIAMCEPCVRLSHAR
jgi:hypothetical protein